MHPPSGADRFGTIPTSELSTIAGGSSGSQVRPLYPGSSNGKAPPPSNITIIPGPRPPLDPGFSPGLPGDCLHVIGPPLDPGLTPGFRPGQKVIRLKENDGL